MKKLVDKNIRSLTKLGRFSYAVTLPVEIVKELKWKERQKLKVSKVRGGIIIRDFRSRK